MRAVPFAFLSLLLSAGCGTQYWDNIANPSANFERDKYECSVETDLRHANDTRVSQQALALTDWEQCLRARGWQRVRSQPPAPVPPVPASPAKPQSAAIDFEANVPNAEVWIDRKFVGTTPVSLPLSLGSHSVEIRKGGYAVWVRSLSVSAPSRVVAELIPEKSPPD